jgi:endonuclease/exonuclease/phosphatase family metal-dependent hydrolase
MRIIFALSSVVLIADPGFSQQVFINEIHYDNAGGDVGEFVEIAGPANTNLGQYELVFYNGANTRAYKSLALGGTIPNEEASGFGALAFTVGGIQNGAPDGIALLKGSDVVQFLSYEGGFVAGDDMAMGAVSSDIGVKESSSTAIGTSLQLGGSGSGYSDFLWQSPQEESMGRINAGQVFLGSGDPMINMVVDPERFFEDDGENAATLTLTLSPAPAEAVQITLSTDQDVAQVAYPKQLTVTPSGVITFPLGALTDGVADGTRIVRLSANDATGVYQSSTTELTIFDADSPAGRGVAIRIAAYNIKNGAGPRGSAQYQAVLAVLRRVDADVIAFSEADPDGNFANLRLLLEDLGMPTAPGYFTTSGDAFAGTAYDSGDFGSGQALAVASIWPITSTTQIGRANPGRREMTRFPLFVEVDVPDVEMDPVFVGLHLKAGNTDADNFRRSVEAFRIREFLEGNGLSGASGNVFILGDLNEDFEDPLPVSYFTGIDSAIHVFGDGSTLPASYLLGDDLAPPNGRILAYRDFPAPAFEPVAVRIVDSRQLDGARRTYNVLGDARIDYILVSDFTATNALVQTEVYNSLLDYSHDGLPKVGGLPGGADSFIASDHHLVFGDFVLEQAPQIFVAVEPTEMDESSMGALMGSVEILPVPLQDIQVTLITDRSRLDLPRQLTVPAGGGPVNFPIAIIDPGLIAPDRSLRITGEVSGYAPGHGFVSLTGRQASGQVLISQYVEPPSGGSPKAIELVNNSGEVINFWKTPLEIFWVPNGGNETRKILVISSGILDPGEVFVIGGEKTAAYLANEGFLGQVVEDLDDLADGYVFYDSEGRILCIKKILFFNGDDALVVKLGSTLADTFGVPGEDPGSQWSGAGVSSANQNIALRDDVATGSIGFEDPSERFFKVSHGDDLSGFGIAPVLMDPYISWAESFGLTGVASAPSEDPEEDGFSNLLEYALGGSPLVFNAQADLHPVMVSLPGQEYPAIEFPRLLETGRLRYSLEQSGDLVHWAPAQAVLHGRVAGNNGNTERVIFRLVDPVLDGPVFVRLRVSLP